MKAETFQDPSVLMKRALFRSLLIAAVAVVLYMFCVEPCQSSLEKTRAELRGLEDQRSRMVRSMAGVRGG